MEIIGLDLSLTATGICAPDGRTRTVVAKARDGDARLTVIRNAVRLEAQLAHLDLAVIEDLPTHAYSAGITGMVHGAVRTALMDLGVPYVLLTPATLKAYATGKGNCDKTAMALSAYKRAGREFADDNQCDAWWLRSAGLDHYGVPDISLPAAQRAKLNVVGWPVLATPSSQTEE